MDDRTRTNWDTKGLKVTSINKREEVVESRPHPEMSLAHEEE